MATARATTEAGGTPLIGMIVMALQGARICLSLFGSAELGCAVAQLVAVVFHSPACNSWMASGATVQG